MKRECETTMAAVRERLKRINQMEQEPKQKPKFEIIPAGDVTNPPQAPIPVVEMLLAQARVIKCRRELAKSAGDELDPESWFEVRADLELALADLAEMELHQVKWNIIQQQRMIQEAVSMPPPIHGVPSKIKM
jgi:hypothetical protein